jgi:hypothetical protein
MIMDCIIKDKKEEKELITNHWIECETAVAFWDRLEIVICKSVCK